MNELNIDESYLDGARLLSDDHAPRQLYIRAGITFLVYDQQQERLIFAFASSALGGRFKSLNYPPVQDITIVRYEPLIETNLWPDKAIYLQFSERRRIVLYSDDRISSERFFRIPTGEVHYLKSPHRLWGPSSYPQIDCMMLTPRLVDVIEDMTENGQQLKFVHTMWQEYQLAQRGEVVGKKLEITGEAVQFSAMRFRGKLVVFDLIK